MVKIKLSVITLPVNFFVKTYSQFFGKTQRFCLSLKLYLNYKVQSTITAYRVTNVYIKPDFEKFWVDLVSSEFIGLLQIITLTFWVGLKCCRV